MSAGKVFGAVFWGTQGLVLINYFEKGKVIPEGYHADLLGRLMFAL